MSSNKHWSKKAENTITPTKHFLSRLSIIVRTNQFELFKKLLRPTKGDKVLDVGATSDETLRDSNMFEKLYKYPRNLTAATVENEKLLRKMYPKIETASIKEGKSLPFKEKEFDIGVSWATLEHTGGFRNQEEFINELLRVSKKVFITTPYRGCIYEPHTGFFFLHWLPLKLFRKVCKATRRDFWATKNNLNPLLARDVKRMRLREDVEVHIYRMFKILPSHIIIYKD